MVVDRKDAKALGGFLAVIFCVFVLALVLGLAVRLFTFAATLTLGSGC